MTKQRVIIDKNLFIVGLVNGSIWQRYYFSPEEHHAVNKLLSRVVLDVVWVV
jgi:hypothetical protein